MPATRVALAVTDRYRQVVIGLRDRTVGLATLTWPVVAGADSVSTAYAAWADRYAGVVAAAQRAAVGITGAYLAAFLAAELRAAVTPLHVDADPYAGITRTGKPVRAALDVSLGLAMQRRGEHGDPLGDVLAGALERNVRLAGDEVMAAPRHALHDLITADERVESWRRVAGPGACAVCLAAADGQAHDPDQLLEIHNHCTCTAEPVISGLPEHAARETGSQRWAGLSVAEQDALAGPGPAQAIRDGAPFASLVAHREMHEVPTQIVQQPLDKLTAA
jgi:hypothetical protein